MYKEFICENDAIDWLNKNYNVFLTKIQSEICIKNSLGAALYSYTGSMSKYYNIILKVNDGLLDNIDEMIDKYYEVTNNNFEDCRNNLLAKDVKNDIRKIYNSFSYNVVEDDIVLFHYFGSKYFKIPNKKSEIFSINNFISTTMVKNTEGIRRLIESKSYNSVLKINVKKGINCIPIGNNPKSQLKEFEVILKPRTRFKIINIKRHYFSKIKNVIECEIEI